jgi:hypothetical protein
MQLTHIGSRIIIRARVKVRIIIRKNEVKIKNYIAREVWGYNLPLHLADFTECESVNNIIGNNYVMGQKSKGHLWRSKNGVSLLC